MSSGRYFLRAEWPALAAIFITGSSFLLWPSILSGTLLTAILLLLWLRQQYFLHRLHQWLLDSEQTELPDGQGHWQSVYRLLWLRQRKQQLQNKRAPSLLKQIQQIAQAIPEATLVLDNKNRLLRINQAAGKLLKLHPKQDLGLRIDYLIRDASLTAYLNQEKPPETLQRSAPQQPERQLSFRLLRYSEQHRLLIARDITQQHQHEQMRRDFVTNASHELRSPLTLIRGYVEILQNEKLPPTQQELLSKIEQPVTHMQKIIQDMLLLAQLESRDNWPQETIAIAALLNELLQEAKLMAKSADTRFHFCADPILAIQGAPQVLYSLFSNLIFNAVQHNKQPRRIDLQWNWQQNRAYFSLRDQGDGIAARHLPRLTERFYRANNSQEHKGTGLGLAIVKQILAQYGSQLHIESVPGQGSCFSFSIEGSHIIRKELPQKC